MKKEKTYFGCLYQKASRMKIRFMRLIVMFDLPMDTKKDKKIYRIFVKELISQGYIRIQYSIYCKLCINSDSAKTYAKRLLKITPQKGDVRYLVITENQYQSIVNINSTYSLQEAITTTDRTIMIGGMNDED